MNRLHGFIKVYHASSTTKSLLPEYPLKQQPNSAMSPGQTGSSSQKINMGNRRAVFLSFAALTFLCTISLCQGQSFASASEPKPQPSSYGHRQSAHARGLEALAPYTAPSGRLSSPPSGAPSSASPSSTQPLTAESSNVIHKFKFAFHNGPNGRYLEEYDDQPDDQRRRYENALPYNSRRGHRYLPGSTSAIYVDSSEELVDDAPSEAAKPVQPTRPHSRRNLARELYFVTENENPNSGENSAFGTRTSSGNHTVKNIVIPLPTHRLNDRSLATGVIVISQDNGFPDDSNEGDIGRHFHYELLPLTAKEETTAHQSDFTAEAPAEDTSLTKETNESSGESGLNLSKEVLVDVGAASEEENESKNAIVNEKRQITAAFGTRTEAVPKRGRQSEAKNVDATEREEALSVSSEEKGGRPDGKADIPRQSTDTSPGEFISSLKARIHLSRPSANSFNFNLVKTTTTASEGLHVANETAQQGGFQERKLEPESNSQSPAVESTAEVTPNEGTSLMLMVEREAMLNKIRKSGKKQRTKQVESDVSKESVSVAEPVLRTRRRQSKLASSSITLNSNLGKSNFVLKQRRNDKFLRVNMSISENATTTSTTTERPIGDLTTTSILNNLVKELNLALKDRLRQLESLNESLANTPTAVVTTTQASLPETTSTVTSTTTEAPETEKPTTEANISSGELNSGESDLGGSEESADLNTTTTMAPLSESDPAKRSAEEDSNEEGRTEVETEPTSSEAFLETSTTTENPTTTETSKELSSATSPVTTDASSFEEEINSSNEDEEEEEVTSEEISTTPASTTTTPTPTTTTPAPTTTRAPTTTQAPTTKPPTKSRKGTKSAASPLANSIKKAKNAAKRNAQTQARPQASTSKPQVAGSKALRKSENEIKVKLNVTLPKGGKNQKHTKQVKRARAVTTVAPTTTTTTIATTTTSTSTTTAKPRIEKFKLVLDTLPKEKEKTETSTQAAVAAAAHWSQKPSRGQFLWSLWNPSTTAQPPTVAGHVAVPLEELVLFQRQPPVAPKIPNNFGFANTISSPPVFDDEEEEESASEEAREELTKRLAELTVAQIASPKEEKQSKVQKETPKKVERQRDFEDDDDDGSDGDDDDDDLSDSNVPGTPGVDYPVLGFIPDTSFECSKQQFPGFYADMEVGCQVYHSCSAASVAQQPLETESDQLGEGSSLMNRRANNGDNGQYGHFDMAESSPTVRRIQSSRKSGLHGGKHSFLCPNGTVFSQLHLVCVWWYEFDCASAANLYYLNGDLYKSAGVSANKDVFPSGQQNGAQAVAASSLISDTVMPAEYGGYRTGHFTERTRTPASRPTQAADNAPKHGHTYQVTEARQ